MKTSLPVIPPPLPRGSGAQATSFIGDPGFLPPSLQAQQDGFSITPVGNDGTRVRRLRSYATDLELPHTMSDSRSLNFYKFRCGRPDASIIFWVLI